MLYLIIFSNYLLLYFVSPLILKNVFRRCLSSNVREEEEEEEEGLCTLDRINIYVLKSFKENEQTLFSHILLFIYLIFFNHYIIFNIVFYFNTCL